MVSKNEDVFIFTGQNFFISILILILFAMMKMMERCLQRSNIFLKIVTKGYQSLISVFFFDFQMICFTELAVADPKKLGRHSGNFVLSWAVSFVVVTLTILEQINGFMLMKSAKIGDKTNNKKQAKIQQKSNRRSVNDETIIQKFSEGLAPNITGFTKLYNVIDGFRFTLMLIIISSLQLLERTQMVILVTISLLYFIYALLVAVSSYRVFESELVKNKIITHEACILVTVFGFCISSFKKDSTWSTTAYFKFTQSMIPVSIVVAVLLEFLMVARECYLGIDSFCSNWKKNKKTSPKGLNINQETKSIQTEAKVVTKFDLKKRIGVKKLSTAEGITETWNLSNLDDKKNPERSSILQRKLRRKRNSFSAKGKEYMMLKGSARSINNNNENEKFLQRQDEFVISSSQRK